MSEHASAAIEDCDECGFRWELWSPDPAASVIGVTGTLLRGVLEGVDLDAANTRPSADWWSILEYVDHIRDALWVWRFATDAAVAEPGIDLRTDGDRAMEEATRFDDVAKTIAAAETEGAALAAALRALDAEQWAAPSLVSDGVIDQRWIARHALHEVLHHLHDVGRIRARLGDGVPTQTGSVTQLSLGGGGVPKPAVPEADVAATGMVGDHQDDRIHHGRPFQALCLYSHDVIEALNAEGHPIYPGAAGENVTVRGIDWASLRPGAVLAIGDELRIEISSYATPCAKNAQWFAERDFRRMLQEHHPGWSRLYATVLHPGHIATGDPVIVEP